MNIPDLISTVTVLELGDEETKTLIYRVLQSKGHAAALTENGDTSVNTGSFEVIVHFDENWGDLVTFSSRHAIRPKEESVSTVLALNAANSLPTFSIKGDNVKAVHANYQMKIPDYPKSMSTTTIAAISERYAKDVNAVLTDPRNSALFL